MQYIASFDIGTTGCKGLLIGRDGSLHKEADVSLQTMYGRDGQGGGTIEQQPAQWYEAVVSIAQGWWSAGIRPEKVRMLAFSGQMQDCIPVDRAGQAVRPAILYSDGRAVEQADQILSELGEDTIRRVTGNHMDGSLTFPKILWMREHEPEHVARTAKFLISSKDYVVHRLTGAFVTDPTSAATTGLMELMTRTWKSDWLERFGVDAGKLPELLPSDEIAGTIHAAAAQETGFMIGTPVMCGIGDAGATTIGAGVTRLGDVYAYLGTSGWIAATTNDVTAIGGGAFHLAHAMQDQLIVIAPLTNAGNAHKWALSVFGDGNEPSDVAYAAMEQAMAACDRSQSGVLFLPYLNGERSPVQNPNASASFIGLRATTTKAEMSCAVLEGVAFAMRQVNELIAAGSSSGQQASEREPQQLVLIGGGSKSRVWNQIFADVFGVEVVVPAASQYLPSIGSASAGFIRLGWAESFDEFTRTWLAGGSAQRYAPNRDCVEAYQRKYDAYVQIYPALESLQKFMSTPAR